MVYRSPEGGKRWAVGRMSLRRVVKRKYFPYIGGLLFTLAVSGKNALHMDGQCGKCYLHCWSVQKLLLTCMVSEVKCSLKWWPGGKNALHQCKKHFPHWASMWSVQKKLLTLVVSAEKASYIFRQYGKCSLLFFFLASQQFQRISFF